MEINTALADVLCALSDSHQDPRGNVSESLRLLVADAKAAVPTYLGVSITMTVSGESIIMTALENDVGTADIQTSLQLPLDPSADGTAPDSDVTVVLFASRPGAFVDLAADLTWMSGRDPGLVVLDQHLTLTDRPSDTSALDAISTINQAIGVLIARGYPPEQAARRIDELADADGSEAVQVARLILAGTDRADAPQADLAEE